MPLIETKIKISNGHLLVWQLEESAEYLKDTLPQWLDFTEYLNISHPQKKREWLAGRHLFVALCGLAGIQFQGIWKNPDGKPFLLGSTAHISLSHSEHLVAATLHFYAPIGIDLEKPGEQLERVAHKYLKEEEQKETGTNPELLCKYWGAKEAVYKLVGERKVSLKNHIQVFSSEDSGWKAVVKTPTKSVKATLMFEKVKDYFLTIALRSNNG